MFLSLITKNLNLEILTKNLVTFKRWDEVKDKKFYYYGGSLKNPNFSGGHEKPIYRGGLSKKGGAWTVCRYKGGLGEKEGVVLLGGGRGVDTPMHPMVVDNVMLFIKLFWYKEVVVSLLTKYSL